MIGSLTVGHSIPEQQENDPTQFQHVFTVVRPRLVFHFKCPWSINEQRFILTLASKGEVAMGNKIFKT